MSKIDKEDIKKIEEGQRRKTFNGLTAKEWATLSSSVWRNLSPPRPKKKLDHGATFPELLVERLLKMYSKEGDVVLDPFLGVGTTVNEAIRHNRESIGIELSEKFIDVAEGAAKETIDETRFQYMIKNKKHPNFTLIQGDCCEELKHFTDNLVQLVITSPPYANLIHKVVEDRTTGHKSSLFASYQKGTTNPYSDDERDLGNMGVEEYTKKVQEIMGELFRITVQGGYNAWVVKDFRDTKNKIPYIDLHTKIAQAGEAAGFLYHDLIVWDQNQNRRLVVLGYPSVFYTNQNHSFIVILRKPK